LLYYSILTFIYMPSFGLYKKERFYEPNTPKNNQF
jgi:hypothetical protein